ncbi:MAG: tetratricopeptide repeat protein, partial [Desulfatitalea sp.]|nr:tetratricopeptide repeat protein [Desulfatitalea sp.]NNK02676.1 tetratricopeptide repeat protein [Desulfatitalea sp.]
MRAITLFFRLSILLFLALTLFAGCASKEEKMQRFYSQGKESYEKGDLVKARLALKNAIQLNLKYAEAYYLLGMVELKDENAQKAFGYFNKAVELDEDQLEARAEAGHLY